MPHRVEHEPMQRPKGRPHPSGRPRRNEPTALLPIVRIPRDEPLTPGLRWQGIDAIGFTARIGAGDDE